MRQEVEKLGASLKPYILHAATSSVAYTVALAAVQYTGCLCRVSCATPILGSVGGAVGVGAASLCAGQVSLMTHRYLEMESRLKGENLWGRVKKVSMKARREDLIVDAAMGLALFKLLGGRFRHMMPSNLLHPGVFASESIAAVRGTNYASKPEKAEIKRLFEKYGCHHCGTKKGPIIADHQPPSGRLEPNLQLLQFADELGFGSALKVGLDAMKIKIEPPKQRFFPQCRNCSQRQAAAVRRRRKGNALVMHFGGMRPWHFAGVVVGLRHYSPSKLPQRRRWL